MTTNTMQPLDDLTIVDLTQSIAGPVCTQLLAEMGAIVIKIEPPAGDNFRSLMEGSMFTPFNHGKQSICIDIKTEKGNSIIKELFDEADIVVESFRPGVLKKYDLDYESVNGRNEDIIYCSLTGFGQNGPYSSYPGYDPCIQAISGLMSITGYKDRPPVRIRASLIDCGAGTNAAFSIMAAIRQLDRGGSGTEIDISLFDVAVSWMSYWISHYDRTGKLPERDGEKGIGSAPNGVFPTGDGHIYIATLSEVMYERLCRFLDREDLLEDARFKTMEDRLKYRKVLRDILTAELETYNAIELEKGLLDAGVPSGAIRTIAEVVDSNPHVEARSMLTDSYNPESGETVLSPSLPIGFSTNIYDGKYTSRPPKKGEHTTQILNALSYNTDEISRLYEMDVIFSDE